MNFESADAVRQTLLCHRETRAEDPPNAQYVRRLWAASAATPVSDEEFRSPEGASIRTNLPAVKSAIAYLGRSWPRAVSFDELASEVGPSGSEILPALLLRTCASGLVELHAMPSPFSVEVSERPRAFALARIQAASGATVTTLRHSDVEIPDRLARELIRLLDGTRDRTALLRDLQPFAGAEPLRLEDLECNLEKLARRALLEA